MERKAGSETQLTVDEAILDYLIYTAVKAQLQEDYNPIIIANHLEMVDSFLSVFHALHPIHRAPIVVQFRLRLLQFCHVFTKWQRCTNTPLYLSNDNRKTWETYDMEYPCLGQADVMLLLETLPLFLGLSALQNWIQESSITELWMRLAAGYMAQAYTEQVLACQGDRLGLLEGLFNWEMNAESSRRSKEGSDDLHIAQMFNADEHVLQRWNDMKEEHIEALRPPEGVSLTAHLESMVSDRFPVRTFKDKVSEFLKGLLSAHPEPLLSQVERGRIEDLSTTSTAVLKRRAGFIDGSLDRFHPITHTISKPRRQRRRSRSDLDQSMTGGSEAGNQGSKPTRSHRS
ncbi:MAG: hypothetical protein Q9228_000438 [Teloschistes exilis]